MADLPENSPIGMAFDGLPRLSPEQAQALGYVIASWSSVEEVVGVIAATLLGLAESPGSGAVLAELSGAARFTLVRTLLVEAQVQDWLDDWDDVDPLFNNLRGRRNDAAHATWNPVEGAYWAFRVRVRTGVVVDFGKLPADELHVLHRQIENLHSKVIDFARKVLPTAADALKKADQTAPLLPGHGRHALAQAQARTEKQAKKAADRAKASKPPT